MKRTTIVILVLALCAVSMTAAQNNEADEAYIRAMTAQAPTQRVQLLKEYVSKYGGKGTQYENFAHANLCLTPYTGKTEKETIDHGEKALTLGGLDDFTRSQILLIVSSLYAKAGQNIEKAKSYANQVVEFARVNRSKESVTTSSAQWNKMMGAGYFALGQAQEKGNDVKGAVDSYANSYGILKDAKILGSMKKIGKTLYDGKAYADAEKAFRAVYTASKDLDSTVFYAKCLCRAGKNAEALSMFKEAYSKQKSGEVAFNIGVILAKNAQANPAAAPEAINILLEASFTYPAGSQQAMQMAESLFFTANKDLRYNETVTEIQNKNKKIDELTQSFNGKFGGKEEENLTDAEKKEMKSIEAAIEAERKTVEKLQADMNTSIAKFKKLVDDTRVKLGVK